MAVCEKQKNRGQFCDLLAFNRENRDSATRAYLEVFR